MLQILRTIVAPGWSPGSPSFHISFEFVLDEDTFVPYRHFTITTPQVKVTLQPLVVSFEAAFGMLSVFAADLVGGDVASAGTARPLFNSQAEPL